MASIQVPIPQWTQWIKASASQKHRLYSALSTILHYGLENDRCPNNVEEVIWWFLETQETPASVTSVSSAPELQRLRSAIFTLVTRKNAIASASPEFVWSFVRQFGPTNVHDVSAYVAHVNKTSLIVPRLGKLSIYYLKQASDAVNGKASKPNTSAGQNSSAATSHSQSTEEIVQVIRVLLMNADVAQSLVTDDWLQELWGLGTAEAVDLAQIAVETKNIASVRHMFPELSWRTARKALQAHNNIVDDAVMYLIENPQAAMDSEQAQVQQEGKRQQNYLESYSDGEEQEDFDEEENARYINIHEAKGIHAEQAEQQSKMTALEYTLLRIQEEDEDPEEEDLYSSAAGPSSSEDSASARALYKIEKYLWDLFSRSAEVFNRSSRKSKQRTEMKKVTGWTDEQIEGWARIIEKSPRRRAFLEDRFMFQGNKPYLKNLLRDSGRDDIEGSEIEEGDEKEDKEASGEGEQEKGQQQDSNVAASSKNERPKQKQRENAKQNQPKEEQQTDKTKRPQNKPALSSGKRNQEYRRQKQKDKHTQKMGLQ